MTPIEKFLSILEQVYGAYAWRGWQMTGAFSFATHGCFVSFQARINDYEITITEHDYRDFGPKIGYSLEKGVYRRRGLPLTVRHWVEITVIDERVRHGRRAIVPRTTFHQGNPLFERALAFFGEIKGKNKVFRAQTEDRLSVEQSILAMCEDIEAKAFP